MMTGSWTAVSYGAGWGGRGGLERGVSVSLIACGQSHTLVLLKSDAVVGWGDNSHGQVGLWWRVEGGGAGCRVQGAG